MTLQQAHASRSYTRALLRRFPALRDQAPVLVALGLDQGANVIHAYAIGAGEFNCADVDPERVFGPAARSREVAAIVLADNRPRRRPDVTTTRQLRREGDLCGVKLLDHLVVRGRRWESLLKESASMTGPRAPARRSHNRGGAS